MTAQLNQYLSSDLSFRMCMFQFMIQWLIIVLKVWLCRVPKGLCISRAIFFFPHIFQFDNRINKIKTWFNSTCAWYKMRWPEHSISAQQGGAESFRPQVNWSLAQLYFSWENYLMQSALRDPEVKDTFRQNVVPALLTLGGFIYFD